LSVSTTVWSRSTAISAAAYGRPKSQVLTLDAPATRSPPGPWKAPHQGKVSRRPAAHPPGPGGILL